MKTKNFILYNAPNGEIKLEIFLQDETLWLTQKMMANLFDVDVKTINEHLQNIFKTLELSSTSVIRNFRITASDEKRYNTKHYNLDAIIAVGYRVNSKKATQFRIWATQILREYIIKGFAVNDEQLKQGQRVFGKNYFKELLERVRSIRNSERQIYLQITDIFAECSIDYNPKSLVTKNFFAMVQNKFHFAITGKTAAEIIHSQTSKIKPNMGLTTWKNSPKGRILPSDATIAKNYLKKKELKRLERTISGFFDYIENLIENRQSFSMLDFSKSIDKFLSFNEYKVLNNKGKLSKSQANKRALTEYKEFNKTQPLFSDFEKEIKKTLKLCTP